MWGEIYGVSLQTHHSRSRQHLRDAALGVRRWSGRWPTRRCYVELLTLFFLARCTRSARGALRFLRVGIFSPPLSPQRRRVKSAALNGDHWRDENGAPFGVWFSEGAVVDFAFLSRVSPCLKLLRPSAFRQFKSIQYRRPPFVYIN